MTTVVNVSMASASADDIKLAWAVYRAADMCRYECWDQPASMIDFERLTRKEKLFFLRCWKFIVEGGGFMRIFGGYETLFANVCDPASDILAFSQEMQQRFSDAELLPVMIEAYEEAQLENRRPLAIGELRARLEAQTGERLVYASEVGPALPPHVYRELVNDLRDTAVKYQGTQQLREQISRVLQTVIQPAHE